MAGKELDHFDMLLDAAVTWWVVDKVLETTSSSMTYTAPGMVAKGARALMENEGDPLESPCSYSNPNSGL